MANPRIGVCSWSLRPNSPHELASRVKEVGLTSTQLALDPLRTGEWSVDETMAALGDAGISIGSGMMGMKGEDYSTLESIKQTGGVRLDAHWEANLEAARANALLAQHLQIGLVTFHAGFIPHDREDPVRGVMIDRLRQIIDRFSEQGVAVAFETGQETAATLLDALDEIDRPVGVNFDPANMILYGMGDPVEALRGLAPRISQIHIKDARPTQTPGTWGAEVQVGSGAVNWGDFFDAIHRTGLVCDCMIEREAGENRVEDIIAARKLVERYA